MRLLEAECKKLLSEYGIAVPKGSIIQKPEEAREVLPKIGGKAVLKIQIPRGQRGKAGGIRPVYSPEEAYNQAQELLNSTFYGYKPAYLLAEEFVEAEREIYIGAIVNRSERTVTFLSSRYGGMEVEEMAAEHPESLLKISVDPILGLMPYQARMIAKNALPDRPDLRKGLMKMIFNLWKLFHAMDAIMLEINPFAVTKDGRLLALDVRMEVDDNSLYRHPDLTKRVYALKESERKAREYGIAYVELDGNIGTMANGAGLAMATMDLVHIMGGKPANFCDVGGGASADRIKRALEIIMSNPRVKVILVNALCGITSGVEVAKGIAEAIKGMKEKPNLVIRLSGNRAKEGRQILQQEGIEALEDAREAVSKAIELAGR
ncbi:MAG: ADP-forming succinate--CoA ligase subunit beta [Thermoproteota archaeon]|nr:MAG: ADP-forming succinate--CoA ligase subunit beta [Candidatus Korarchaeota archaeon]